MKKRTNKTAKPSFSYIYMFSKNIYKKNNKVIKNITQEVKNNKLYTRGYINGKKINKTKKLTRLIPNFIYKT